MSELIVASEKFVYDECSFFAILIIYFYFVIT